MSLPITTQDLKDRLASIQIPYKLTEVMQVVKKYTSTALSYSAAGVGVFLLTVVKVVEKLHEYAKRSPLLSSGNEQEVPLPSSMKEIVEEAHAEVTEAQVAAMEAGPDETGPETSSA
mmetsp:Transcript_5291/g.19359  ORF Transcript_5291/g.19359 Transcript_5291/m.19359 type:complete len:117 (+) Transcript_5291:176-526(+)